MSKHEFVHPNTPEAQKAGHWGTKPEPIEVVERPRTDHMSESDAAGFIGTKYADGEDHTLAGALKARKAEDDRLRKLGKYSGKGYETIPDLQ